MKGQFSFTIEGIETKVDGIPVKLGKLSITGSGERSWLDMMIGYRIFKMLPKWMSRLMVEAIKMEGIVK